MSSDLTLSTAMDLTRACLAHPMSFALIREGARTPDWNLAITAVEPDAIIYEVDLGQQIPDVRRVLLDNDFAARFLSEAPTRPIPYVRSYVRGVGPIGTAYTLAEIPALVLRAKREKELNRVFGK